jgi:putative nucleotidyltransferase with HDIG domain
VTVQEASTVVGTAVDETPPPKKLVERLASHIAEISSLPTVAIQIANLANDSDTDCDEMVQAIRSDPALAMRMMRTVNSSFYGLTSKVSDLKQGVVLVGFEEVRKLALTAYVAPLFRQSTGYGAYTRRGLWNHMVATGVVAELIARECGGIQPQQAYLAGLLHDVGIILIDQYLHKLFQRIVDQLTEETPLCEVEIEVLGFDHQALGAHVAARWNLPEHLVDAIRHHHALRDQGDSQSSMVQVVALADIVCQLKHCPPLGVRHSQAPPAWLVNDLGLTKQQISLIIEKLQDALEQAQMMAEFQLC